MPAVSRPASLIQCSARCDTALDPRTLMKYLFPDACHDEQTVEQMMVFNLLLRKICGHFLIIILSHIIREKQTSVCLCLKLCRVSHKR